MRSFYTAVLAAGLSLGVAACSSGSEPVNEAAANAAAVNEVETLPVENGAGVDFSADNAAGGDGNHAAPADAGALNEGNAAQ